MKKLLLMFTMLFSLSSCATDLEFRLIKKHNGVDPQLQTYVHEFKALSQGKVDEDDLNRFSMGFKKYSAGSSIAGTCHYGVNEVDINIEWWNSYKTASERLELVFHELGHCILKRGHTEKPTHKGFLAWMERLGFKIGIFTDKGYIHDGCPASFMHPYTISDTCINRHFHYYINELFNNLEENNYVMSRASEHTYFKPKEVCKEPEIINHTEEWTKKDIRTLKIVKRRCIEMYGSCLKVLIKKAPLTYNAICE